MLVYSTNRGGAVTLGRLVLDDPILFVKYSLHRGRFLMESAHLPNFTRVIERVIPQSEFWGNIQCVAMPSRKVNGR